MPQYVLDHTILNYLISILSESEYQIIGPVHRNNSLFLEPIKDLKQHPAGFRDVQAPGKFSLEKTNSGKLFEFTHGADSWKKFLYPSEKVLFFANKNTEGKLNFHIENSSSKRYAFFGVRSCELSAINIHDEIFINGQFPDHDYAEIRNNCFIIAVNCTVCSDTCFCASMNTGPEVKSGYDIALTEITDGKNPVLIAKPGSEMGKLFLEKLSPAAASDGLIQKCDEEIASVIKRQKRKVNITAVKDLVKANINSVIFDKISEKCMSCTNCTLVCPTCFCSNIEDTTDITGETGFRIRKWDSCFRENFTEIHGGKIRGSIKSRYRQWLSHKLTNWFDQFGSSGCVGCGRCITWCPAGIDITESAEAFEKPESG
ncbi:MAG: 4Fe-4S dicluster domain-containing protein [Spirochaetia bacterium]|nr:4Fe-4S dicluster domain-containing protein [Spirochaetia bacterium]